MYLLYNALIYLCLGVLQAKGSQNYTASILFLILCFIWLKVIYICIYIYIFATQKFITGFEFTQVYIYTYPVFKSQMAFHKDFGVWHWCIHHLRSYFSQLHLGLNTNAHIKFYTYSKYRWYEDIVCVFLPTIITFAKLFKLNKTETCCLIKSKFMVRI